MTAQELFGKARDAYEEELAAKEAHNRQLLRIIRIKQWQDLQESMQAVLSWDIGSYPDDDSPVEVVIGNVAFLPDHNNDPFSPSVTVQQICAGGCGEANGDDAAVMVIRSLADLGAFLAQDSYRCPDCPHPSEA